LGIAHTTSWAVPFLGTGLICFRMGALPTITMSYGNVTFFPVLNNYLVVDCYFPAAPELMLLIVGLKNVFGFGFGYAIIPWINASGYTGTFGTLAGILVGGVLLRLPLWYWGKKNQTFDGKMENYYVVVCKMYLNRK
jgi:hypothetical protein